MSRTVAGWIDSNCKATLKILSVYSCPSVSILVKGIVLLFSVSLGWKRSSSLISVDKRQPHFHTAPSAPSPPPESPPPAAGPHRHTVSEPVWTGDRCRTSSASGLAASRSSSACRTSKSTLPKPVAFTRTPRSASLSSVAKALPRQPEVIDADRRQPRQRSEQTRQIPRVDVQLHMPL